MAINYNSKFQAECVEAAIAAYMEKIKNDPEARRKYEEECKVLGVLYNGNKK